MSVDTKRVDGRRDIQYSSFDEFLEDARRLAEIPHRTVGNWSYGQILHHLTLSLHGSIDGFGYSDFWLVRLLASIFFKKKMLESGMPPGDKIAKKMQRLEPHEIPVDDAIEQLAIAVERFKINPKRAPSPIFGKLAPTEANQLQLRHAELHMSFVHAVDGPASSGS